MLALVVALCVDQFVVAAHLGLAGTVTVCTADFPTRCPGAETRYIGKIAFQAFLAITHGLTLQGRITLTHFAVVTVFPGVDCTVAAGACRT